MGGGGAVRRGLVQTVLLRSNPCHCDGRASGDSIRCAKRIQHQHQCHGTWPKRGEQWEKVGNWTQGEKRGRVSHGHHPPDGQDAHLSARFCRNCEGNTMREHDASHAVSGFNDAMVATVTASSAHAHTYRCVHVEG
eukprot:1178243-Prorocentrum_minimum.AAC.5